MFFFLTAVKMSFPVLFIDDFTLIVEDFQNMDRRKKPQLLSEVVEVGSFLNENPSRVMAGPPFLWRFYAAPGNNPEWNTEVREGIVVPAGNEAS